MFYQDTQSLNCVTYISVLCLIPDARHEKTDLKVFVVVEATWYGTDFSKFDSADIDIDYILERLVSCAPMLLLVRRQRP